VSKKYPNQIGKCPFCLTFILGSDDYIDCPGCEVPHHKECWQQNGGCTTFACEGKALANQFIVDKDYDFEDLIEEYSFDKIVINLEDLFDDSITDIDKSMNQSIGLSEENRNDGPAPNWPETLFWITIIIGLLIWLFSETM